MGQDAANRASWPCSLQGLRQSISEGRLPRRIATVDGHADSAETDLTLVTHTPSDLTDYVLGGHLGSFAPTPVAQHLEGHFPLAPPTGKGCHVLVGRRLDLWSAIGLGSRMRPMTNAV